MAGKSMREVSEWGELKTFFDRRLIKALGHPVREHVNFLRSILGEAATATGLFPASNVQPSGGVQLTCSSPFGRGLAVETPR